MTRFAPFLGLAFALVAMADEPAAPPAPPTPPAATPDPANIDCTLRPDATAVANCEAAKAAALADCSTLTDVDAKAKCEADKATALTLLTPQPGKKAKAKKSNTNRMEAESTDE